MVTIPRLRPGAAAAFAFLSLGLAACAGEPAAPETIVVDPVVVVEKSGVPEPVLPQTWPLTGVEGEVEARPALAVKVETTRPARPQSGVEAADQVWEEMIEGGETRLNAVFNSQLPPEVGPIRSVRPMDGGIVAPLHGLLVFSGGQPRFVDEVAATGVQELIGDRGAPGTYRVDWRKTPYNLYGDPSVLIAQANDSRQAPPPEQFRFAESAAAATAVVEGAETSVLDIRFPAQRVTWDWDGARWLRSMSGEPHTQRSGERLAAENVVVMRVALTDTGTMDVAGSIVWETVMVDSGEALVASGGKTIPATWSKSAVDEPVVLSTADGESVELAPGVTWIELVPRADGPMAGSVAVS